MADQPEQPTNLPETILHNFRALTLVQRMGVLVLLALGIAVLPILALTGSEAQKSVLFSNLEPEDVQAIITDLDRKGIQYEVTQSGDTIKVPTQQVHDLRLQLATEGLPESNGVGFEIFDRVGLGVTQFVQQMNYRRALQGELARTISRIAEVSGARVHLVIPEKRLFSSDRQPAQAAVVVTLKRGTTLTKAQVSGITNLVASSVEGLKPTGVTVVDTHGHVLSHSSGKDESRLTASQVDVQRQVETDLEQRVQSMLDQVLGHNHSVVRVSAPLEFRHVEVTEETFDPDGQVVRSEQRSQEKVTEETSPSGVPGTRSNIPNDTSPESGNSPKQAKRKNETVNYELNRKVSKIVEPTGTIKRLSVAVLVDGTYQSVEGGESGESIQKYVPRTEEEMQKLTEIVKNAVGFSQERGDQMEVVNTPFEPTPLKEGDEHVESMIQSLLFTWGGFIKPLAFLALGLLVLFFVIRPMVTNLTTPPPQPVPIPHKGLPATVAEYEAQISETPEDQAVKLAAQNPSTAAFVIRSWIKEEQGVKTEKV